MPAVPAYLYAHCRAAYGHHIINMDKPIQDMFDGAGSHPGGTA